MRLLLPRHPDRLTAKHPVIIEEFLALVREGQVDALGMMIKMLADLYQQGRGSRYLRNMTGTPIWELKSQSRGGQKGGSRIYLFVTEQDEAVIVNCEVKDGDEASTEKLKGVLQVIKAYKAGVSVFEAP
jgi:hypothetical protein